MPWVPSAKEQEEKKISALSSALNMATKLIPRYATPIQNWRRIPVWALFSKIDPIKFFLIAAYGLYYSEVGANHPASPSIDLSSLK